MENSTMAIINLWDKNQEYKINKIENKYVIEKINKTFKTKIIKKDKKIFFIEINSALYKAKILNKTENYIEIFIFNFNKSFLFSLKKIQKTNHTELINTDIFKTELKSPLAGRVIKIHVKENEFIKKNQTLISIESMKMENEIKASDNCFIKTIQISQSDLVKQNQILMTFIKKGDCSAKPKNKYETKKIPNRRII
ncbi:biotin/lipoyl-binding protein [Candidatus Dependentiae bacterium]|nr:biotin/lipoyl-binding protein [Candidatus Dependentiae bacterium]